MEAKKRTLLQYMKASHYVIPVYQRNYDWRQEQCKRLFNDLEDVVKYNRNNHFFGCVVAHYPDSGQPEYQLIDGQQRMTTVSLILLALRNLLNTGKIASQNQFLAKNIYQTYLTEDSQTGETRLRLKTLTEDHNAFEKLFKPAKEHVKDSNLTSNYDYFCERILNSSLTADELFSAIERLEIVAIWLQKEDDPQLIFESLNATGLALDESDKIRNFILMGQDSETQVENYETYWHPIEKETENHVTAFIRDYLSIKMQQTPPNSKVYIRFKEYVEKEKPETKDLLEDLLAYAERYHILLKGGSGDKKMDNCIFRMNRLETTIVRPFFLEVLRLHEQGNIESIEDVRSIFQYTENYIFRRIICDLPNNTLNKLFATLHNDILKLDGTTDNFKRKFKYIIRQKKDHRRFPNDTEFKDALSVRSVYLMTSKNRIYLLERFNNGNTLEDVDIYRHCDNGEYTIEHVMPQNLTPAWYADLGDDWQRIHEKWLHRLANLTLTAYNSKYSNLPFHEKRDRKDGFKSTGIRLNTWIAQQAQWGEKELLERNEMLMQQAVEIWPMPTVTYSPLKKERENTTLGSGQDVTGRKIIGFVFKNSTQQAKSWRDMLEQVIRMLYEEDASILKRITYDKSDNNALRSYFSPTKQPLRTPDEVVDGIFLELNTSTEVKLNILHRLFKAYEIDEEELTFYLSNGEDVVNDEAERFKQRRAYWEFALKIIIEKNISSGLFSKNKPTKDNWLTAGIGIPGFGLTCIANKHQCAVGLNLDKPDGKQNTAAFDFIFEHSDVIKQQWKDFKMDWMRREKERASYVLIYLPEIGIEDENSWERCAQFHAEWTMKFYSVFVPLLKEWNSTH